MLEILFWIIAVIIGINLLLILFGAGFWGFLSLLHWGDNPELTEKQKEKRQKAGCWVLGIGFIVMFYLLQHYC